MTEREISRRSFLKLALTAIGAVAAPQLLEQTAPEWIDNEDISFDEFQSLVEICKSMHTLGPEQLLDILEEDDFATVLGLFFSFLIENGEDPEEYLIMQGFLS